MPLVVLGFLLMPSFSRVKREGATRGLGVESLAVLKSEGGEEGRRPLAPRSLSSRKNGSCRRPFRALLDVGLVRTATGNRVFGALKGALDGGLTFPTVTRGLLDSAKSRSVLNLDAEVHRKYIFCGHVAAYMKTLMEDEPEKYQVHFSEYIKRGIEPDDIEGLYKKVHAAIHADPSSVKSEKQPPKTHKRIRPPLVTKRKS